MSISAIQGNYNNTFRNTGFNNYGFTTGTIYPNSTHLPLDTVEISGKKKGLTQKQKYVTGAAVAGALTAAVLLMRGKVGAANKEIKALAKHIDFVPAKTTEEAINFAKTNLGIKKYSKDMPLDVMNWVNEGLVNVNNATKGKAVMPKKVAYKDFTGTVRGKTVHGAMAVDGYGTLYCNNTAVLEDELKSNLKTFVDNQDIIEHYFGKDIVQISKRYLEHPETFSFKEKTIISDYIGEISRELNCMTLDIPVSGRYKIDGFRKIYHEMGHLQHQHSAGMTKFMQMRKPSEFKGGKASNITSDFLNSQEKQQIASRVSIYATKSPVEFVAETYAELIKRTLHGGKKLPDDVMKLYAEYKGPAL